MSKRPWYKRYGGDFVMGTMALSLEEKGAYSICLDLIYDRSGPIPDDDRWLAGVCGVSIRKWRGLRARLIEAGKIIAEGGSLTNERASRELNAIAEQQEEDAENGSKGGRKRAENLSKTDRKPLEKELPINKNNHLGQACQRPETRDQIEAAAAGDARARDGLVSEAAHTLSDQIAVLCGHDLQFVPPAWCGAPMRVQAWIARGWQPEIILIAVRQSIAKRKTGPPVNSVRFFENAIAEEHARQAQPLPNIIELPAAIVEVRHGQDRNDNSAGDVGSFATIAARLRAAASG